MNFPRISILFFSTIVCFSITSFRHLDHQHIQHKQKLGEQLFNDPSLSRDGTMSCAGCHNSAHAFIDPRPNSTSTAPKSPGAVSLGQDNKSFGDINVPTITYAAFVPEFHFDENEQRFKGGMFFNGRAIDLEDQAKNPFLGKNEMQTTKEAVVSKVKAKYREQLESIYGYTVFESADSAFNSIVDSIGAFERSDQFASFDSKFDRVLAGKEQFTEQEKLGQDLFTSPLKGNCSGCHPVPTTNSSKSESLFTNFAYSNLGIPKNTLARSQNNKGLSFIDEGLFANVEVNDPKFKGVFRTPTLRNIAVTGPYMHNGIFRDLETVVQFYNSRDVPDAKNPETQKPWAAAEVESNKNTKDLGNLKLTEKEVKAIVAFMNTFTDKRYEHLIPNK